MLARITGGGAEPAEAAAGAAADTGLSLESIAGPAAALQAQLGQDGSKG